MSNTTGVFRFFNRAGFQAHIISLRTSGLAVAKSGFAVSLIRNPIFRDITVVCLLGRKRITPARSDEDRQSL